jgi:hypothetical protein
MTDTTITIGGFQIHEPTTVLTDILIAILAISFYKRLSKFHDETIRNWSYFFLLLGTATLIGSSSHAFFAIHEGWKYKSLWLGMQVINGIGIYFAQRATLISVLKDAPSRKRWEWSYYIQFILFLGFLFCVQKYIVSIIENALALIPIMILHYQHKRPFARTIANGIAVSFLTAFVHLLKLSLHAYFNYNDIAHVFIMISLWIMYKGVRLKANPPDQIQP